MTDDQWRSYQELENRLYRVENQLDTVSWRTWQLLGLLAVLIIGLMYQHYRAV